MLLSGMVRRLGRAGWLTPSTAKRLAKWVAHLEHAGGGVVGIEFLMPHYFSGLVLTAFAALFFLIRVMAAEDGMA